MWDNNVNWQSKRGLVMGGRKQEDLKRGAGLGMAVQQGRSH